ncbi:MAG TPA: DUF58 domain-containing protein [Thermoanaerobaculia bacterium]
MTAIPTPAPATADFRFDGVVRLTRIGTTFIIFTIVVGFAALNTGNNSLYIGLTFMLGSLLFSGLASKGGLKRLEVELESSDDVWAGRPSHALLRITNRSRIWNVRDIVITSTDLAAPVLVPVLEKGAEVVVSGDLLFSRRGRVEMKTVDLYTRYPFGFFLKKRAVRLRGELIVFPRLLEREYERNRFRPTAGEQTTANLPGPGSEIHSFREFAHGDSLRHVYWKKSASLGRWIIKQTDADAARTVAIVVDPYKPRGARDDEFEDMVSAAATFVHQALERGLDVVLQVPRLTLRSKDGQAAHSMFRALALIEPAHEPIAQTIDRDTILFALGAGR